MAGKKMLFIFCCIMLNGATARLDASSNIKLPLSDQDLWISSGEVDYQVSEHDLTNTESGNTASVQLEPEHREITGTDISGNVSGILLKEELIPASDNQKNINVSVGYSFERLNDVTDAPVTTDDTKGKLLSIFTWVLIGCGLALTVLAGGVAICYMMRSRRRTSGFRFQNLQESCPNHTHSKQNIIESRMMKV